MKQKIIEELGSIEKEYNVKVRGYRSLQLSALVVIRNYLVSPLHIL